MAGIYIHIPFCKKRCSYCDFFSSTDSGSKPLYVNALCRETALRADELEGQSIETVYFGGGTPSQLELSDFEQIFDALQRVFGSRFPKNQEITLEANPDDVNSFYISVLKQFPFNRISLGVQSFDDLELTFLNRRHNAKSALEAIGLLKSEGFDNISIDLMYGLPGQSLQSWQKSLEQAVNTGVQHISAYHLTYEQGTPLYRLLQAGKISPADEETSLAMFEMLIDSLSAAGFEHYEISNFALPGFRSRHNSSYWNGAHYIGLGASAHSYNGRRRQWNASSLAKYVDAVNSGCRCEDYELIDEKTAYNDFVMTRLRTAEGISPEGAESLFGKPAADYCLSKAGKFITRGLLTMTDGHLRLTKKGIFLSDGIICELMR
ncbi:MAG: radical SAM family heme chaperone HemW [Dysgonamonadaceae bacterium]|jgi:oxygen-independent coproporphyrinogen-3 oxidase|nr:radical SAM family heme chaperone HemW [Dysgonamonadaceae bacterium]